MNELTTSLDALNDIVLPPAVPWWPPAPGWYGVIALLILVASWLALRSWKRWNADAYRRAALRELADLRDAPAIALLLRRTALAVVPRSVVAEKTGIAWADWLAAQCTGSMPADVRRMLTAGVYGRPDADSDVSALRDYAARWIARHCRTHPCGGFYTSEMKQRQD